MDIYLQDLGQKRQKMLMQWRATSSYEQHPWVRPKEDLNPTTATDKRAPLRLSWLGRLWAHGIDSPPEIAASGLSMLHVWSWGINGCLGGLAIGAWIGDTTQPINHAFSAGPTCFAALMVGLGLWLPRHWLRQVCRPAVSVAEIEALCAAVPDDLEQAYLRLVVNALRQAVAPDAAGRVRAALRAVGEAIDALPALAPPHASADALRAEAAQAQAEARAEPDTVVAASYERRADALERSASAAQRSQTLMRRAAALRAEMMAQIELLRLGLTGFETASGDVSSLASLADAVRDVAEEAVSVADARAELDAALPGAPLAETVLRLRAEA